MAASYGGEHALIVAVSICLGHYLLSTVGIWRSAGCAIKRTEAATPETQPIFAYLSRSWVILGLPQVTTDVSEDPLKQSPLKSARAKVTKLGNAAE